MQRPDYPVIHLYEPEPEKSKAQQETEVADDNGETGDLKKTFTVECEF